MKSEMPPRNALGPDGRLFTAVVLDDRCVLGASEGDPDARHRWRLVARGACLVVTEHVVAPDGPVAHRTRRTRRSRMPAQLSWTLLYSARPLEAFRMRMPVSPLLCTLLPRSTASLSNVSPMYRPASLPEASFSMKRLPTESKLVIPYSPLAVVRVVDRQVAGAEAEDPDAREAAYMDAGDAHAPRAPDEVEVLVDVANDADPVEHWVAGIRADARGRPRRRDQEGAATERTRAVQRDAVLLDGEVLAIRAGLHDDRVARMGSIDRSLDRLDPARTVIDVAAEVGEARANVAPTTASTSRTRPVTFMLTSPGRARARNVRRRTGNVKRCHERLLRAASLSVSCPTE